MLLDRDRTARAGALLVALCTAACGAAAPKGPPQWEACRGSAEAAARVQADVVEGSGFGIQGTPTLVVNGTSYFGLPQDLEGVVTAALVAAQADGAATGVDAAHYYDARVVAANVGGTPVPVGTAPVRGAAAAWVTIVEFSDFQCPFCRNAEPTIEAVLTNHPADVRLAYKEYPLTQLHENALPAALAADCAGQQGQFWPMHDLLIQGALDEGALVGYANQLGLK